MGERPIRLGLLDFSWVKANQSPAQALKDTLVIGQRAEVLGYSRYWLGEHHLEGHASGSPQILAGVLAASTRQIRIGVGCMLLHYWAPLKLAEDFLLLEALFGRIDFGVGRGRADNLRSHRALLDGRPGNDEMIGEKEFGVKLDELVGYLRGTISEEHPHYGAAVIPDHDVMPEIWVCGSATAAPQAARTGTRFCCTLFHGGIAPPIYMSRYREAFSPSEELPVPYAAIAVAGVCAETEAEAVAMRESFPIRNYLPSIVGTPEQCKMKIEWFSAHYDVDEIILLDIAPDRARHIKSIELLAQVFELKS
jgi:luciferase family oxidoreductase group 1